MAGLSTDRLEPTSQITGLGTQLERREPTRHSTRPAVKPVPHDAEKDESTPSDEPQHRLDQEV